MFSIDYPFTPMAEGMIWLEGLRKSGLVDQEQLEMICHGNAEKLFGLPSTSLKLEHIAYHELSGANSPRCFTCLNMRGRGLENNRT